MEVPDEKKKSAKRGGGAPPPPPPPPPRASRRRDTDVRIERLKITEIRRTPKAQARVALNQAVVREYSEAMAAADFPPVSVRFDGNSYWLSDGFHRLEAAVCADRTHFDAEVRPGGLREAIWDSLAANSNHGLRRTAADTQAVIRMALQHPNSFNLSNCQLGRHIGVSEGTVRAWRQRLSSQGYEDTAPVRVAVRRGKPFPIQTARIGAHMKATPTQASKWKSHAELEKDLEQMMRHASPEVCQILQLMEHWLCGPADAGGFRKALEDILDSWC